MDRQKVITSAPEVPSRTKGESTGAAFATLKHTLAKRMETVQSHFNLGMKRLTNIRRGGVTEHEQILFMEDDLSLLYQYMWQLYCCRKEIRRRFPIESEKDEECFVNFRKIEEELAHLPDTYLAYYQKTNKDIVACDY